MAILLNWIVYPGVITAIIFWLDGKFLNKFLAFNFKFLLLYALVSITAVIVIPIFFIFDRCDCVNAQRASVFLRQFSHLIGVTWEVRGMDILTQDVGCIIVANHQSSLDVLGMFWIWRYFKRMAAVAKQEIFYFWPFGLACYLAGVVFVDRRNAQKAKEQLNEHARLMSVDKTKLFLFPEGTRNKSRGLQPFKKGAFHMAIACQAPIMPIVYSPYFFISPKNRYFGSGRVVVCALPLVPTSGLTLEDVDVLKDRVRSLMLEKYDELAAELKRELPPDHPGLEL